MPEIVPKDPTIRDLEGLHLWHAPLSSCSQRVRIVLAETGKDYESHLIDLEKDEHASAEYQAIHPSGLVPAMVDNGRLFIESVDIIQHLAGPYSDLLVNHAPELLQLGNEAQIDLKLLTFEFLFRGAPPPPQEMVQSFQKYHQNEWLKQFRRDFAAGFDKDRIDEAVRRTSSRFRKLDARLSDVRGYLAGDSFSLADITWMPNVHRFNLMGWPFEQTPHLKHWFDKVSTRPSYTKALLNWQNEQVMGMFAAYTEQRRSQGTDISTYGALSE
jgi:glutathione S-transferase